MKKIYLDYAAATPLDSAVFSAMKPYLMDKFYNPAAQYLSARSVAGDVESARSTIAHWLGARPSEIIFTAGGTEANNLAINGVMSQFSEANIIVSAVEHEAVLKPASQYDVRIVKVQPSGLIDLEHLANSIDENTVLVSVMYANNEVGTIQPLKKVASLVEAIRQSRQESGNKLPLYFHTDACQAAAYLDLHTKSLGLDMMTINAGKIYGPKQCGALYVRTGVKLHPQILGGGQERGMRSGTENVANIVGFAAALDLVQNRKVVELKRLKSLQELFFNSLLHKIPDVVVNGTQKQRLPNNIHITIPGQDNERLMMQLDEYGVQCAVGSACSASSDEPSHVLKAMGLTDAEAQSSLRFSMGIDTTEADIRLVVPLVLKSLRP